VNVEAITTRASRKFDDVAVKERWDEMLAGSPTRFVRYDAVGVSKVICELFVARTIRG